MKNFPAYESWYLAEAHKTDAELERTFSDARAYRVRKGSRLSHAGDIGFDYGDSPGSLPLLYFPGGKNGYYHPSDLEEVDAETAAEEIGWDEDLDEGRKDGPVSEYKGSTPAAGPDPDEYEGEEAEAFDAGAAADKGEENPHDRGTSLYQAWDDGYASNRRHSR